MNETEAFQILKSFFTERRAPAQALASLKEKVEIGIVFGGNVHAAVFRSGNEILVENREAIKPDFIFSIRPETAVVLAQRTKDEIADIGLGVIKEMMAGGIQVRMTGGLLSVLSNGYLEIVASGGAPITAALTKMGLGSPTKIVGIFRNLKK